MMGQVMAVFLSSSATPALSSQNLSKMKILPLNLPPKCCFALFFNPRTSRANVRDETVCS